MATYLQGNQDYIPQIQPFKPDYNFLGNVLQTKQGKYDTAKKKINDIYGSALYAPLSREGNITRRDEFFKSIDQDIKKISGLDLSLEQNVNQAAHVFDGFFEDKYIFADMTKTKQHIAELDKSESSKYCYDQDKCGGTYNPASVQKLQYKMEEFKKAGNDESLNFDMGSYDAYYNWQKDAIKVAKDSGISFTKETTNGKWIMKDKNGNLITESLYSLFKGIYGDDPRIAANYETQAYVTRKNTIKNTAALYGSEEKAENVYLEKSMHAGLKVLETNIKDINTNYSVLNSKQIELENKKGAITNDEKALLDKIIKQKEVYNVTKKSLETSLADITSNLNGGDIVNLRRKADQAAAHAFEEEDMIRTAETLSHRDEEHMIDVDPYGKAAYDNSLAMKLAAYNDELATKRDVLKSALNKDEALYKAQLEAGLIQGSMTDADVSSIQGDPGSTQYTDANEDPEILYAQSTSEASSLRTNSAADSNQALWQTFAAAKKDGGPDAVAYLNKMYGSKWKTVDDPAELNALTKANPYAYLLRTTTYLNAPTTGAWGKTALKATAHSRTSADEKQALFSSTLTAVRNSVKTVVNKLSADPAYKYAKHILDANGFVSNSESPSTNFVKAYIKDNPDKDYDDAKDAYTKTRKAFYPMYNSANGSGLKHSNSMLFNNVDVANRSGNSKIANDEVRNTLSQVLSTPGSYKVLYGNSSAANYGSSKESDPDLDAFLTQFRLDLGKSHTLKDKHRPVYQLKTSAVAGDSKDLSSMTVIPSKEYIKQYIEENPKLKGLITNDIFSKGVTIFYNNKMIKTQVSESLKSKNIEKILVNQGSYTVNTYAKTAGTINVKYDKNSGATIYPTYIEKVKGRPTITHTGQPIHVSDLSSIDASVKSLTNQLAELELMNEKTEYQEALDNQQK